MTGIVATAPCELPTQPCPECDSTGWIGEPDRPIRTSTSVLCRKCRATGTIPAPLPAELWLATPPATPDDVQVGDRWCSGENDVQVGRVDYPTAYATDGGSFFTYGLLRHWNLIERAGHPWPYTPAPGARVGLCNQAGQVTHTATVRTVLPTVEWPTSPEMRDASFGRGEVWISRHGNLPAVATIGPESTFGIADDRRAGVWVPGGTATLLCDLTAVTDPGGCPACDGRGLTFGTVVAADGERSIKGDVCALCRHDKRLLIPWLPDGQPRPTTPHWTPIGDAA